MDINDLITEVNRKSNAMVNSMTEVNARALGLDGRAGYCLYVNQDCIAVETSQVGPLKYYGAFEYIDDESVVVIGHYTFFLREDCKRVDEIISRWENSKAD